jgi:FkbM family methyltransferase
MNSKPFISRTAAFCRSLPARTYRKLFPTSQQREVARYYRDNPSQSLRYRYPLDRTSVVLDCGGYDGQWASDLFSRYCCRIHVFEVVPEYAAQIRERFAGNPSIAVHDFGLGSRDQSVNVSLAGVGSSLYHRNAHASVTGRIVCAADFLRGLSLNRVDLLKINIEGGEYDLIRHLVESQWINRMSDIQVQFHDFVANADAQLTLSHTLLSQTHTPTYQYRFVWENWRATGRLPNDAGRTAPAP